MMRVGRLSSGTAVRRIDPGFDPRSYAPNIATLVRNLKSVLAEEDVR